MWWSGRVGDGGQAGSFEDLDAEVAAALDPLVVLLGEHGADQPDQRVTVRAHPELDLDSRLTPQGREIVERVKQSCYVEDLAGFATLSIDDITEPNILADPEWQAAYGESLLGTRAPGAPAFVYHTTSDTIVPFAQGQKLYGDWCSEGADVVFQKIPGLEHLSGVVIGSPAGVAWMSDRLAGKPVESGCREVGLL